MTANRLSPTACRLSFSLLLIAMSSTLAVAGPDFDMVVLGDRTGNTQESVFETILNEVKLLKPSLLMNVGDLVEGYTKSHDTLEQEWDTVIRLLNSTGVCYHLTPGEHDITNVMSETVFVRHFGNPYYSFNYNGCHFLVIDNSRWNSAGAAGQDTLPEAELAWIDRDLALNRMFRWTFVFMNRSYWTSALRQGRTERLHDIFKHYRVNYVFSGDDHFYCSAVWDSIHYIQVGPSGSGAAPGAVPGDEERGAFQNYLQVHVADSAVRVEVVKPGNLLPIDCVTLQDIALLDSIDRHCLELSRIDVAPDVRVEDSLAATIRNVTSSVLSTRCIWDLDQTNWSVDPETALVVCNPGVSASIGFQVRHDAGRSLYPLPRLNLTCPWDNGKQHAVSRLLPIRRSAVCPGVTADRHGGLPLREFGSKDGGLSPTEPFEVYVAHDDTMLYLAARCTETQMLSLKTAETARDGKVADDDNLNFLLCPNPDAAVYYQLIINPTGTILDRRCRFENGHSINDDKWNGDWRVANSLGRDYWMVELSIPFSGFGCGPAPTSPWGFNVARFQARNKAVGIYQVPFDSDPGEWGVVTTARLTFASRNASGNSSFTTAVSRSAAAFRHWFKSALKRRSSRP